jgi:hypothetical protein
MFKCDECNHEFAKPERFKHKEYADYGIGGEWLTAYISDVCPDCGSEDYEEIVEVWLDEMDIDHHSRRKDGEG